MTEQPIDLTADQVLAVQDGRMTQLWVPMDPQPAWETFEYSEPKRWLIFRDAAGRQVYAALSEDDAKPDLVRSAPWQVGNRLWVRETWGIIGVEGKGPAAVYQAGWTAKDDDDLVLDAHAPVVWHPGIGMPLWASRIALELTGLRAAQVCDLTEADAKATGADPWHEANLNSVGEMNPAAPCEYRAGFLEAWHGQYADSFPADLNQNPWAWGLTLKVIQ